MTQYFPEILFCGARGRAIIICQVEVGNAEIERAPNHCAVFSNSSTPPKLCQSPSEMAGNLRPLRPQRLYLIVS